MTLLDQAPFTFHLLPFEQCTFLRIQSVCFVDGLGMHARAHRPRIQFGVVQAIKDGEVTCSVLQHTGADCGNRCGNMSIRCTKTTCVLRPSTSNRRGSSLRQRPVHFAHLLRDPLLLGAHGPGRCAGCRVFLQKTEVASQQSQDGDGPSAPDKTGQKSETHTQVEHACAGAA